MTRIICGVDIASSSLEARIGRQGAFTSFANNAAGIAALATFCRAHQVELVAMEATGGYEQQAFALLAERDLPVAILNPRAVRNFAQSMGRLEKTDAIDAGMIAWYAEVKQSMPLSLAPRTQQHLRALVTRLRQLTQIRTAQLNQQRLITEPVVQASFHELLSLIASQIQELEQRTHRRRVKEQFMSGVRSGVNGTPTFFINGERFDQPWDVDTLTSALRLAARLAAPKEGYL